MTLIYSIIFICFTRKKCVVQAIINFCRENGIKERERKREREKRESFCRCRTRRKEGEEGDQI